MISYVSMFIHKNVMFVDKNHTNSSHVIFFPIIKEKFKKKRLKFWYKKYFHANIIYFFSN